MITSNVILDVRDVSKTYVAKASLFRKTTTTALREVSFSISKGRTFALLGESGSGKTTLAKIIMKLETATNGKILIDCQSIKKDVAQVASPQYNERVQMIFQDPYSSLNPRKKIWQIIAAPLVAQTSFTKNEQFSIAEKYSRLVGLGNEYLHAYPRSLSGGQKQRVGIARALVLEPDVIILDEALSALDLSIQAQIINLLLDLQARLALTYLFISHDVHMVEHFADEVAIMHRGEIVELGSVADVFRYPSHQYTRQLVGKNLVAVRDGVLLTMCRNGATDDPCGLV